MMVSFCFRATGTRPIGESRITPAVRYLVDEVNRTLRYMAVSSAFYARPQKYVLGLNDEQFDAMMEDKWQTYIGSVLLGTVNETMGAAPTVGQLASASPQPYIDALQAYGKLFSGATCVPLNSLGIVQDNPSSAEAIAAQREDVCIAAEDCIESSRESMREVALLAMAVEANTTPEELSDEQRSVVPKFKNPLHPNAATQADAMTKMISALPWLADSDVALEEYGFPDDKIQRLRSDRARYESREIVARAVEAARPQADVAAGQGGGG